MTGRPAVRYSSERPEPADIAGHLRYAASNCKPDAPAPERVEAIRNLRLSLRTVEDMIVWEQRRIAIDLIIEGNTRDEVAAIMGVSRARVGQFLAARKPPEAPDGHPVETTY